MVAVARGRGRPAGESIEAREQRARVEQAQGLGALDGAAQALGPEHVGEVDERATPARVGLRARRAAPAERRRSADYSPS